MGFLDEDYLLESASARRLYDEISDLPILDPHSHVDVAALARDEGWNDIWEVEGETDHYVWELMRKRGVSERKITGDATNREKWNALASVFPEFAGNPTYEWVHLDLKRRFGIEKPISAATADEIWEETKAALDEPAMRQRRLLREMNVEVVSSTDDPTSDLEHHRTLADELDDVTVRPTWRPDAAMGIGDAGWREYVATLGDATDTDVSDFDGFLAALRTSHEYFEANGCGASDHGLSEIRSRSVDRRRAADVYERAAAGEALTDGDVADFEAFVLERIGEMNRETDWVTQLHIGPVRDYRDSLYDELGADAGGDISTGDLDLADGLRYFLNRFDEELEIVLYVVDPTHYPTVATVARAFPNVSVGAAWWFNDSPHGIRSQLEYVGTVDLLANYGGMVSDSRKLLSFGSRFEMFRRSLANVVGEMVERGQMPMTVAEDRVRQVAYERPAELWDF
ncbi:glucuronate isomerase [Halorubrum saccharovorum DSM 1137]|uniref:Uronate isomerase n=1 Tax=Halorubrum saccharovorum DSM 1137 TaxID=1227484 RepID=M0DU78_9EURY|nr:glucuronate isomerase [Halorubrum saccharovorum]ELZ39050.1 glucuronate isomerase [Halorubrum saccharovorum DSM 1137]